MATEQLTLDGLLGGLTATDEKSMVDIAVKLLDSENPVMHTEITNVRVMNALLVAEQFAEKKNMPKTAEFWKTLYKAQILHMVSYKRKRPTELKEMFASLLVSVGLLQKQKTGLFGGGKTR